MQSRLDLQSPCDWSGALALLRRANEFLCDHDLTPGQAYAASLVLEEVVTNVVKHAHDDPSEHELRLDVSLVDGKVRVTASDDGRPFDPTDAPPPPAPESLEDIKPGGLGLTLIRAVSESVTYRREGGRNVVEVVVGEPDWERLGGQGAGTVATGK